MTASIFTATANAAGNWIEVLPLAAHAEEALSLPKCHLEARPSIRVFDWLSRYSG